MYEVWSGGHRDTGRQWNRDVLRTTNGTEEIAGGCRKRQSGTTRDQKTVPIGTLGFDGKAKRPERLKEDTKTTRDQNTAPIGTLGWRVEMSKLGKRYKCEVCGTELLCTKAGEGTLVCCENCPAVKHARGRPLPLAGKALSGRLPSAASLGAGTSRHLFGTSVK